MVSQIPFKSNNIGKIIIPIITRIKVLKTEISAEILPFEKAVNIEEVKQEDDFSFCLAFKVPL